MTETRELVRYARTERAMTAIPNAIRQRPRTALVMTALAIVTVGIAMNWSALVAAGIAPLLISALPCAVMCALGLCMSRMGRNSCTTDSAPQPSAEARTLQVDATQERIESRQLAFDLRLASDREAAGADQTEQEQERRPVNA